METEAGHPDPEKEDSKGRQRRKGRTDRRATRRGNCIGGGEVGKEILKGMERMEAGMRMMQGDIENIRKEIT